MVGGLGQNRKTRTTGVGWGVRKGMVNVYLERGVNVSKCEWGPKLWAGVYRNVLLVCWE